MSFELTNNKKIAGAYWRYSSSNWYHKYDSIYTAYKKPSSKKVFAWQQCESLCCEMKGTGLKVIGAGSHFFSAGFVFLDETEEHKYFCWITPAKVQYMKIY